MHETRFKPLEMYSGNQHTQDSIEFDHDRTSRELSKEKFSLDESVINGSPSQMQATQIAATQRSRLDQDLAIKEMSHFGGSQNQSIYSAVPPAVEQQAPVDHAPLKLKFGTHRQYDSTLHQDVLAMARPEYHGKDFFLRTEFRGLLLADY